MAAADTAERPSLDGLEGWPEPEAQPAWRGDPAAEATLRDAYLGGRMHHAWLIGGPRGIGKATLAYRFARFALAHPDPGRAVAGEGLAIPATHPAFRKVAAGAHPNVLSLRRPWDEKTRRYRTELTVDEIRRTVGFFGSTAGERGWRIAIVDPADDMNPSAANALLKILEEPPADALFLVISHTPGRLLPTIRSRCRRLDLAPLASAAIDAALAEGEPDAGAEDRALAARLAQGSLRRAVLLLRQEGIEVFRALDRLLGGLPELDTEAVHAFAERVTRRGAEDAYEAFLDLTRDWLARRVRRQPEPAGTEPGAALAGVPLASWAEVWEKLGRASDLADAYNLDRKQVVLSTLMSLARAARM
jgi:DNA polymerase-3 subunit delta'